MQVHGAQFSATRTLAQHFHETKFVQTLVPHRKTGGATCGFGKYDISGLPALLLTFGFAFVWESFVVRQGDKGGD